MKTRVLLCLLMLAGPATADEHPAMPSQVCSVTGSQGLLDFGALKAGTLLMNRAPAHNTTVSISCRYPQTLAVRIAGDQAGQRFAWGSTGNLNVTVSNVRLENKPVSVRSAERGALNDAGFAVRPGTVFYPVTDGAAAAGRHLSFDVTVSPELDPGSVSVRESHSLSAGLQIMLE